MTWIKSLILEGRRRLNGRHLPLIGLRHLPTRTVLRLHPSWPAAVPAIPAGTLPMEARGSSGHDAGDRWASVRHVVPRRMRQRAGGDGRHGGRPWRV